MFIKVDRIAPTLFMKCMLKRSAPSVLLDFYSNLIIVEFPFFFWVEKNRKQKKKFPTGFQIKVLHVLNLRHLRPWQTLQIYYSKWRP